MQISCLKCWSRNIYSTKGEIVCRRCGFRMDLEDYNSAVKYIENTVKKAEKKTKEKEANANR